MNWGTFKKVVENKGVVDSMVIQFIDIQPYAANDVEVDIEDEEFSICD